MRRKKKNDEEEKQGNGLREIYPEEEENLAKEEDAKDSTEGILENSEENVKEGAYEYQEEYAQEYEDEYATAPEEIEEARAGGFLPVSLGKRILRTETAGMTVLSILMYLLEQD